jgi:Contact-dependent growth inhibition CdiA C-terminal domain
LQPLMRNKKDTMKTTNELLFDNLDYKHYTNSESAINEYELFRHQFRDLLGYDKITDGCFVIQKGHQRDALLDELPIAVILKHLGHFVILLDESRKSKQIDALVDGVTFEMKNLRSATNIFQRIKKDCQSALSKGTENVVININVPLKKEDLVIILRRLAKSPQVYGLKMFWCILDGKLIKFNVPDFQ